VFIFTPVLGHLFLALPGPLSTCLHSALCPWRWTIRDKLTHSFVPSGF
jgi:hypothetical protein